MRFKIVDKSKVTEQFFSAEELFELAGLEKKVFERNPNLSIAVIPAQGTMELSTQLYGSIINRMALDIRWKLFPIREEAEQWIRRVTGLDPW